MSYAAPQPASGSNPEPALRAALYFLARREFNDCKKYALKAQQSNPDLPGLSQIMAVADVLIAAQTLNSETQPDYYSMLNLNPLSNDTNLLKERFINLITTLTPSKNPYPFADEALELVRTAWYVLSNPSKKNQFDSLIKNRHANGNGEKVKEEEEIFRNSKNMDTFWTVCPYCYYVFEYAKVYEDCCLRCWNEKCGRGFHGFAINSPPADILRDGKFMCPGFYPVGFDLGRGGDGGSSSWIPFAPRKKSDANVDNVCGWDNFVDISDGEDSLIGGVKAEESSKEMESEGMHVKFDESFKEMETGETNVGPTVSELLAKRVKKSVGKNTTKMSGTGFKFKKPDVGDQNGGEVLVTKRVKKSVGKNTRKLGGSGFRVTKPDVVGQGDEEMDMASNGVQDMGSLSNGVQDMGSLYWGGMGMEGGDESFTGEVELDQFFDDVQDMGSPSNGLEDDFFAGFDDF